MTSGAGLSARIVLLHGFTQTGASWGEVAERLRGAIEPRVEVLTPDLPGHGSESSRPLDLTAAAARVGATCGRATYVGYSMGGRVGLHLALTRPDLVDRLVLIGATPGIEDAAERAARRAADEELARSIERDGVASFLERWLDQPLFASLDRAQAGLAARLTNTPEGLAASLRLMGTGQQTPSWDQLPRISAPTLLITGEFDEKFTRIARRMSSMLPRAELRVVEAAGHAVQLEHPEAMATILTEWLGQADNDRPAANAAP